MTSITADLVFENICHFGILKNIVNNQGPGFTSGVRSLGDQWPSSVPDQYHLELILTYSGISTVVGGLPCQDILVPALLQDVHL